MAYIRMADVTRYRYVEQGDYGRFIEVILTEQEILDQYYNHWYKQVISSRSHRAKDIQKMTLKKRQETCIQDFCVVNWASKYTPT